MLKIPFFKNFITCAPFQKPDGFIKNPPVLNAENIKFNAGAIKDSFEFIAGGAQGCVYRILGTSFAIKMKNKADLKTIFSQPLNFNLSDTDRINRIRAKIGNDFEIMDFVQGEQIKNHTNQKDFKIEKITDYLKYIYNAALKNIRHDCGGKNTLFDNKTGNLTPIDFYQGKPGYKHFIINDAFLQLYLSAKNANDAESLLSKIALSFLELLKTDIITKKGLLNIDTGLKNVKDIIATTREYQGAQTFVCELEKKLKDIAAQKSLQGILPDAKKVLTAKIENLEKELQDKII